MSKEDLSVKDWTEEERNQQEKFREIALDKTVELERRKDAVYQLKSQALINQIALDKEMDEELRCIAVCNTLDYSVIHDLAYTDLSTKVRISALRRFKEGNDIYDLALSDYNPEVRKAAFECIANKEILKSLSERGFEQAKERLKEIEKEELGDKDMDGFFYCLKNVIPNSKWCNDACLFISTTKDESVIKGLFDRDNWDNIDEVRSMALDRIKSEELLETVARNHNEFLSLRKKALKKIKDQRFLERMAESTTECVEMRVEAIKYIKNQDFLYELATKNREFAIRYAAIGSLTDNDMLNEIASMDREDWCRYKAMTRLTDPTLILKYAEEILKGAPKEEDYSRYWD